jgi:uncharacterized membrane protein
MAIEKWAAFGSIVFFALFSALMITVYNFMIHIPEDDGFLRSFSANPKIFQFISMGFAPAGILAGVSFIMSKHYGSKPNGIMIVVGGIIMLVGMYVCYSMINRIEDNYITDAVRFTPILFMAISVPVMGVGAYLTKQKKIRPKKQYF